MSKYRDPRIDPQPDDVLLPVDWAEVGPVVVQERQGDEIVAVNPRGRRWDPMLHQWQAEMRGALVLWQLDGLRHTVLFGQPEAARDIATYPAVDIEFTQAEPAFPMPTEAIAAGPADEGRCAHRPSWIVCEDEMRSTSGIRLHRFQDGSEPPFWARYRANRDTGELEPVAPRHGSALEAISANTPTQRTDPSALELESLRDEVLRLTAETREFARRIDLLRLRHQEIQRLLLAMADACDAAHIEDLGPYDGAIVDAIDSVLETEDWGEAAEALRRLCEESDE